MATPLMTAGQFFELPEPAGNFSYGLHFGRVGEVEQARELKKP
jgi:hypothetical protein